jgi:flavin reductase (DIM6/NTAB) family NADH-FMN oxidoreductase RutF
VDAATQEAFEALVGELDYPMLVVTAAAEGEPAGCLVGFASQAAIDPPRFLVCLSDKNRTFRAAREAEVLGVHFLGAADDDLARLFGGETGDEVDKFSHVSWKAGPDGAPLLDRCPNRFAGRVLDRRPVGDHVAFLLEPVLAEHGGELGQFEFHRAKRIDPGHEA